MIEKRPYLHVHFFQSHQIRLESDTCNKDYKSKLKVTVWWTIGFSKQKNNLIVAPWNFTINE